MAIEGFRPTRANWFKLNYAFHTLSPRSGMKLAIVSPGGQPREITVMSAVKKMPKNYDLSDSTVVWNLIRDAQNDEERTSYAGRKSMVCWFGSCRNSCFRTTKLTLF